MLFLNNKPFLYLFVIVLLFSGCQDKPEKIETVIKEKELIPEETLFRVLNPKHTGVSFSNSIKENPRASILSYQYFYNGGGVAVGDLNNDGLEDLFFSGNIVPNKLYLNKGDLKFEDVTAVAGVPGRKSNWKTGVSMADINGDGLLDLYVCYSGDLDNKYRVNELFINQGPNENGVPVFKDQAQAYGLADSAFSIHSAFFDLDRDGDLDMLLLNHNPFMFKSMDEYSIQEILKHPEPMMRVKLYRNDKKPDGTMHFTDISDKAGLPSSAFSYALGAGVADINKDGWPDIYLSNDYSAPDYLFMNNGNGTFTDKLKTSMGHTSLFSMGNNVSDINNDGRPDIFVLDMLPESNRRQKLLFSPDNYEQFEMYLKTGFHYQYMRNMLHLNTGTNQDGAPLFSETGQLSGISNTDWSWAPLFADFDNDGWKDLFITNGFLKDLTNMDFVKFSDAYTAKFAKGSMGPKEFMSVLAKMPSTNVSNYIYKNNGDLTFSNQGAEWGVNIPSNSNGAVYADLDNDGDLDLVTNNINEPAFVYQNQSSEQRKNHFLQLKLEGAAPNTAGIGAKITLHSKGAQQYLEQMPNRGYQSSVSPLLHFGTGDFTTIDSIHIVWPGGKEQYLMGVAADQLLVLQEKNATTLPKADKTIPSFFREVKSPLAFRHKESRVNDFKRQPLLVNPLSFSGPCLVKADVNGDGLEDVFAGGNVGQSAEIFLQQKNGSFLVKENPAFGVDKESEDTDAVFFDVNNDGSLDLYVCSGGYANFMPQDSLLQDRLYLNDGRGNFTKSKEALPVMLSSTSCIRVADINGDGYQDLFVGGRVIPGRYPETPDSYILINDQAEGKAPRFKDMTKTLAPQLQKAGMVTDAAWQDLNGDNKPELIVVGEWMPIMVFSAKNGILTDDTPSYFDKSYSGWWNKLLTGDFDQDGVTDLIVGNMGLNSQVKVSENQPAQLYYKDFDENGSVDPILSFYINGTSYPYVTRDELLDQLSMMRTRFTSYTSYADATINTIFSPDEMKDVNILSAAYLKTAYFKGNGKGKFTEGTLPAEAQFSPVYSIQVLDYDKDGNQDLLLCGNINEARLRFGKYDANYGLLLQGNGKGAFTAVDQGKSGFQLKGDVRSVLQFGDMLLFGINQQEVKAYKAR